MEKRKNSPEEKRIDARPSNTDREFSAGGVVYKNKGQNILWLITKSTPSKLYPKSYWRLPKGWLDDTYGNSPGPLASGKKKAKDDEIKSAALREVREEGGVVAKIIKKIGTERIYFTRNGKRILKFVTYYLMEFMTDYSEGPGFETSKTGWFSYEKARKKLRYPSEKKVIGKAKQILDTGLQQNLI